MSEEDSQLFDFCEAALSDRDDGDGGGSDGGSATPDSSPLPPSPLPSTSSERSALGGGGGGGEEEGHDQGASSAATNATSILHACSQCTFKHKKFSLFACVYKKKGFPFAKTTDVTYERAKGQADITFPAQDVPVDIFDNTPVEMVCIHCCSKHHDAELKENNKTYFKKDGSPSSFWIRLCRDSKSRQMAGSHALFLLKLHEKANKNNTGVSSTDVYVDMKNNMVDKKKAWRSTTETLGGDNPFLWLFDGCPSCKKYPFRSRDWYRARRNVERNPNFSQWHCAACFQKWSWTEGRGKRLIVIGDADDSKGYSFAYKAGFSFAYAGHIDHKLEDKIQFLKTAEALTQLDGRDITISKDTLLEVIAACNDSVSKKFSIGKKEVREIKSKVVTDVELALRQVHLICQDGCPSMHRMGHPYCALDLSKSVVHDIEEAEFQFLIEVSAAMLDVEAVPVPAMSPAMKLKKEIMDSAGFKKARTLLKSMASTMLKRKREPDEFS